MVDEIYLYISTIMGIIIIGLTECIIALTYLATKAEIAEPMNIWVSWPTIAGSASRPCAALSPVMYEMSVTATGADFWEDTITTAMASKGSVRRRVLQGRKKLSG